MSKDINGNPVVVRTARGLSISGTRKTLYQVMDYIKADWPPKLIRDWMDLTDAEIAGVMQYIAEHRLEIEEEYQEVLRKAEEERHYWEERNRERFAEIAAMPPGWIMPQRAPSSPRPRRSERRGSGLPRRSQHGRSGGSPLVRTCRRRVAGPRVSSDGHPHGGWLAGDKLDRSVWRFAQSEGMLLLTNNRNALGADSLTQTIGEESTTSSLPVLTIGNLDRLAERQYRSRCAERMVEIVIDVDLYLGTGRMFIP